jgi:hypothetical protein
LEKNGSTKRVQKSAIVVLFVSNERAFFGDKDRQTAT